MDNETILSNVDINILLLLISKLRNTLFDSENLLCEIQQGRLAHSAKHATDWDMDLSKRFLKESDMVIQMLLHLKLIPKSTCL